MYYLKDEYPNNIIVFNHNTNEIVCRLMWYDYNSKQEALEQAENLVEVLNKQLEYEQVIE